MMAGTSPPNKEVLGRLVGLCIASMSIHEDAKLCALSCSVRGGQIRDKAGT
jgi:hypothetical protein